MNRAILSGLAATMMVGCGTVESEIDDAVYDVVVPHYWRVKGKCTGLFLKNDTYKIVSCNNSNGGAVADARAQCLADGGVPGNVWTARLGGECTLPNGGGNGDPHMFSADGLRYDQQALGEFVFATDNRTFTIQVREEQYGGSRASVQTAVSVDMGDLKIGIYARETPNLRINGAPAIVPCASQPVPLNGSLCNGRINFDNGGWLVVKGNKISVYLQDEVSHLDTWLNGTYMNTQFFGGPSVSQNVAGIIGNMNGSNQDDFQTREGAVLPQPVSFNDLYRKYADSWRVSNSESTFDYAQGKNTQSFTDFAFPGKALSKADIAPAVWASGLEACKTAGVAAEHLDDCAMDAAIMGNDMAKDYVMPLRSLF